MKNQQPVHGRSNEKTGSPGLLVTKAVVPAMAIAAAVFAFPKSANGTEYTWTGANGNSNWTEAGNWDPAGGPPGSGDTVLITGTPAVTGPRQATAVAVDKITFDSASGQDSATNFQQWNLGVVGTILEIEAGNIYNNTVNNGRVVANTPSNSRITLATGTSVILHNGSGSLLMSGNLTNGAGRIQASAGGASTLEFDGSGTTNIALQIELEDNGGNTLSVVKNGSGKLILNSVCTYTGATTVNAGTLGGSGTIAGTVTVNDASIAPGESIGTFTVQNDVTWNGSASAPWVFDLGAGDTADLLDITGGTSDFLKGTGTGGTDFVFDFAGSTDTGTFDLVSWGGTTTFADTDFTYANLGGGNTGSFQISGNTLQFVVGSVAGAPPEITSFSVDTVTDTATINFKGAPNTTYNCKSSTDLTGFPDTETAISGSFTTGADTGDGTGVGTADVDISTAGPKRFYRLETP
jgi:autotransporter-associated beta strand protein